MNREIKFRVFHKALKIICDVLSIDFVNKVVYVLPESELEGGNQQEWHFDEVELMQFIGLPDKNKKDMFDKDIIEKTLYPYGLEPTTIRYLVVWNVDGYQLINLRKRKTKIFSINGESFYQSPKRFNYKEWECCKVLGNLFENPELLTENK